MLVAACAALAAAAPADAADGPVERGIVQSVGPAEIVLRALDGTEVTVEVGPATGVRLNGGAATLAAIRSGLVAEAVTVGDGPALVIRAFGRVSQGGVVGELVRIGPRALVVRRDTGLGFGSPSRCERAWRGSDRVAIRTLRPVRVQVVRAERDGEGGAVLAGAGA